MTSLPNVSANLQKVRLILLAIETATEACSVAASVNGKVQECYHSAPRQHTKMIVPMIDKLLQQTGITITAIDAIAFGRGPGSFTGIRIATGLTQGIAFGLDIPVIPISSLATLAQYHAPHQKRVATAIDARMGEVYWGLFQRDDDSLMRAVCAERVCKPGAVTIPKTDGWFGTGSGWDRYHATLSMRLDRCLTGFTGQHFPRASALIPLASAAYKRGDYTTAEQAMPVYLRDKVV